MKRRNILVAAYVLDWIAGDPEWFPHPVRLIGKGVESGERVLRRQDQTPTAELVAGGALTLGLATATYVGTAASISWIKRRHHALGIAFEMLLTWTCLASRSLHNEASAVVAALEADNLVLARQRVSRVVGRDTDHLDTPEISRAVIETVAESCSDGVIAPLFYLAIGGVPLAMTYKTINTLDSMIGHTDERYFYFGKLAARLDDVMNFLPARLTALGITTVAALLPSSNSATALDIWFRDGMKHKSPNAGQPESAMAGALRVRLGGENYYQGQATIAPTLGEEFSQPSPRKAKQAIQIVAAVSALGILMALRFRRKGERTF